MRTEFRKPPSRRTLMREIRLQSPLWISRYYPGPGACLRPYYHGKHPGLVYVSAFAWSLYVSALYDESPTRFMANIQAL